MNQTVLHLTSFCFMSYVNVHDSAIVQQCVTQGQQFSPAIINAVLYPILNPSGRWADFNPIWRYYGQLWELVDSGQMPRSCMPLPPDINDYPDTTLPRYWQF